MNYVSYKLTYPQRSILLTEQFHQNTCVSNIAGTLSINEKIDVDILEQAINIFIKKNDSLRINLFGSGRAIKQIIKNYSYIKVKKVILTDNYSLNDLENDIISKHFTLLNSDLYQFVIFKNQDGTGGFIANLHHIISDAWTMSILIDQIVSFYSSLLKNEPIDIDDNQYSYIDFINDEQKYLVSSKCQKSKIFWEEQFENLNFSYLSEDYSNSYDALRKNVVFSEKDSRMIKSFCNDNKISLFVLFMSALSIYLAKINNSNFSTVGTPVLNRCNYKEKHTTGMFISTVPFSLNIDDNMNCLDFFNMVSKQEFSIFRHQKYPYDLLLKSIRKKFNVSKNLYDVSISYQNARDNKETSDISYSTKWMFNNCIVNNLDIHIYDMDNTGLINVFYDFKKDIFDAKDIDLLHKRLFNIFEQMISNPEQKISDIKIISPEEESFIFNDYNKTETNANFISVYDMFKKQLQNNPKKLAVSSNEKCVTYEELNNIANNIAYFLKNHSVNHGDTICLAFENSIEFIASIIATQKLGVCYIPIDVKYPVDRVNYIIENSNSKLILTHKHFFENITSKDIFNIDLNNFSKKCSEPNIDINLKENDLSYMIYTSGSTGKPKGVKISHKSLSNYISWAVDTYVNNEETNFPLFSSIAFDLTVTSIYTPLCSGNCIYIYKNDNIQLLFKDLVEDKKTQIVKLTPAHFSLLQDLDLSNSVITKFILGGDALTTKACEKISSLFNHKIHIYNEYGPTEATVGCMIYEYNPSDNYTTVPIGKPINNTKILILNKDLELLPLGKAGEMYISGDSLSLGYTNPQKTAESFIDSPFENGKKLYKTGDSAILYKNGVMEYLGRSDFQVNLNGYRIELGEIQSTLLSHKLIKDTCVVVNNINEHNILSAYYVSDCEIPNLDIYLSKTLPSYMIPNHFTRLAAIPLTINGKVDKSALPLPKNTPKNYVSPKNELEKTLQEIFSIVLGLDNKIGVTENIFDYYIDSLTLIKLQSILYSKGINVNTQYFYEQKTIRNLSDFLLDNCSEDISSFFTTMPNIDEIKKINTNKVNDFKNITLFGATGFLGIHILYELLVDTSSNINCVIRKKDNVNPISRLKNKFAFYFPNMNLTKYWDRIKVIDGNILDESFSLDENLYNELGNNSDCVIDTAALVKHYGDYELFNKTNVNSTKEILSFCKKFKIPFHYVSTMSVSGLGLVHTPSTDFYENNLYIGQMFKDNVYVRSKFEAEKLIIESCKNENITASIYRVGTITNRYSDGEFQENFKDNAFLNRLKAFVDLQVFPEVLSKFNFEFTPVDYCAKFIVSLLKNQDYNLNIYHLFNNNYINCINLVNILRKLDISLKCVSIPEFKEVLSNSNTNYFGITAYLKNIDNFNELKLHNEQTNSILKTFNLEWPKIDLEYISKVLNYIQEHNYLGGTSDEI